MTGILDRARTIAKPGYSRWLVPPAALAIHLCIGQVYSLSVFNLPMTRLLGITRAAPEDWKFTSVAAIFSIAIVFLGLSAALFGKWLEHVGPRKAMFSAACCFSAGFLIAALGVQLHSFSVVVFGYGVVGGIGLGLGYISPVSTLIKWFPDRPGMATGFAIMGFGGGAMIGSPLLPRSKRARSRALGGSKEQSARVQERANHTQSLGIVRHRRRRRRGRSRFLFPFASRRECLQHPKGIRERFGGGCRLEPNAVELGDDDGEVVLSATLIG